MFRLRRTAASFRIYRKNFFRRRYYPSEPTMRLLRTLYPKVDWRRVHFYEGLPWFTPPVAPFVTAQALPRSYSFGGYSIHLKKFDETRAQCMADIVHEAFHIMQAMTFARGYGAGFTRGWMIYYLADYIRHGYRNNPFEIPAYNQEFRFLSYCARRGIRGMLSDVHWNSFNDIGNERELVYHGADYRFKGAWWQLVAAFFICVAISIIKPLADAVVFIAGGIFYRKRKPESINRKSQPANRQL